MLFGYPLAATENNWLHDCVIEAIRQIHAAVDASEPLPAWPTFLPSAYQAALKPRTGLRNRFRAYYNAVRGLDEHHRDAILKAVDDQNSIAGLLNATCDCVPTDNLHADMREPIRRLFDFAFDLLADFRVRDRLYKAIYDSTPEHVCPFCGVEYFDAPGAPREALDHYLAKSRYTFAAVNLRNLVPMGHKCNSTYKHAVDILYNVSGERRRAFDPYNHTKVSVSLDSSSPFDGSKEHTPKWEIHFHPESPALQTWDEVFSVRERYRRDHLDPAFARWFALFGRWARSVGLQANTDEALVAALFSYEQLWEASGMQDRAFLKAAVFRMLRRHCESGHTRLIELIRDLVTPPPPVAEDAA